LWLLTHSNQGNHDWTQVSPWNHGRCPMQANGSIPNGRDRRSNDKIRKKTKSLFYHAHLSWKNLMLSGKGNLTPRRLTLPEFETLHRASHRNTTLKPRRAGERKRTVTRPRHRSLPCASFEPFKHKTVTSRWAMSTAGRFFRWTGDATVLHFSLAHIPRQSCRSRFPPAWLLMVSWKNRLWAFLFPHVGAGRRSWTKRNRRRSWKTTHGLPLTWNKTKRISRLYCDSNLRACPRLTRSCPWKVENAHLQYGELNMS